MVFGPGPPPAVNPRSESRPRSRRSRSRSRSRSSLGPEGILAALGNPTGVDAPDRFRPGEEPLSRNLPGCFGGERELLIPPPAPPGVCPFALGSNRSRSSLLHRLSLSSYPSRGPGWEVKGDPRLSSIPFARHPTSRLNRSRTSNPAPPAPPPPRSRSDSRRSHP